MYVNRELLLQGLISHAEVLEKETHHRGSPSEAAGGIDSLSSSPPVGSHGAHGTPIDSNRLLSRGSLSYQLNQWEGGHEPDAREDALLLYEHGQACDVFTLLLQGKALIRTGVPLLPKLTTVLLRLGS